MHHVLSVILLAVFVPQSAAAQVTRQVLERVSPIRVHELGGKRAQLGSAFTIEVGGHQYVITACHLMFAGPFTGCRAGEETSKRTISLGLKGKWVRKEATVIVPAVPAVDIVAFDVGERLALSDTSPLPLEMKNYALGQQVYFVGYPTEPAGASFYATRTMQTGLDELTVFPFLKAGILSAFDNQTYPNVLVIYLDGHNNPGFSGGPIVYRPLVGETKNTQLLGVVSGYQWEVSGVLKSEDLYKGGVAAHEDLYVKVNSGIVKGFGINSIVEAIEKRQESKDAQ